MGCVASRIDKEERVQICKERKKLMKKLVGLRAQFAAAQIAYLQSLKNTGITLRQFTESEFLELDNPPFGLALPPSPPPLPPSPPPPPSYSPDERNAKDHRKEEFIQEECIEITEDNSCTTPPLPDALSSSWDFWDPFGTSSPPRQNKSERAQQIEEEVWAETNTEFEDEEDEGGGEEVVADVVLQSFPQKPLTVELPDDNSSRISWYTKDTGEMSMVIWRSQKTLAGIVRELDDYFLKASAGGKEIAVLLDINSGDPLHQNFGENNRKSFKSAKVFSALSWSWSSKSLQSSRDSIENHGSSEPCMPGALCITLEKLYTEEQRLYQEIKEEEMFKLDYEKKILLLQKQEDEDQDWMKIEKIRSSIESLQSNILCLQQSISRICSSILHIRDKELHPQLVDLSAGLMRMWRTMYECHQVQNHIVQQVNHVIDHPSMETTTEYHRQATIQLEAEVNAWYNSFCNLLKSQRDFVRALNMWIQLTDSLLDDQQQYDCSSGVYALCEEWQLALDRLPEKVASDAIKSLLSIIHSIVLQQNEESNLQKKYDRLERRLQKELNTLDDMEKKLEGISTDDAVSSLATKHPLSVKRAKTESLRRRVEDEKAKYLISAQASRAMTLNNLQTSLPNVFQALTGFSSVCAQAFEAVHSSTQSTVCCDGEL
ncbi:PREDICTED: uncharacterized protein LOC104585875 [Nelumbo nucifera]|uniref:Uncharacterized protein LOC104585875 n=1 Tax=Nelumbo nucifera TaxID=4432 RepID=A0A1U8QC04_NELNU|nr:PREDICTED: uncharacterized protein LOC104585875 [Nelumbo nucifera]